MSSRGKTLVGGPGRIYTGTPEGVGAVLAGNLLTAKRPGPRDLSVRIVNPRVCVSSARCVSVPCLRSPCR